MGAAPGQFINPTGVAVDNSGGPQRTAQVYIADTGNGYGPGGLFHHSQVQPRGRLIWGPGSNGEDTPGGPFDGLPWNGAIAIDGNGNLFVTTSQRVMKLDAEDNEYVGGSEWLKNGVFSIAVNQGGSKLMVTGLRTERERRQLHRQRQRNCADNSTHAAATSRGTAPSTR